jgi:hypothetical protein
MLSASSEIMEIPKTLSMWSFKWEDHLEFVEVPASHVGMPEGIAHDEAHV